MKKTLDIPDDARLALECVIHLLGHYNKPTMSTGRAGRALGCEKDKVLELVRCGALGGYKLPSSRNAQLTMGAVDKRLSDEPESNDPRHHRIPTISVLMTVIRSWINGTEGVGLNPSVDQCRDILEKLVLRMDLRTLREHEKLIGTVREYREAQLKMVTNGLPAKGPRSPEAMKATPELPLTESMKDEA